MPVPFMVKKTMMEWSLFTVSLHQPSCFADQPAWLLQQDENVMSPSELVNINTLSLSVCKLPF